MGTKEILIDAITVLKGLNKIVDKFGRGYTYMDTHVVCRNFDREEVRTGEYFTPVYKPSCIVGNFFDSLGLTYDDCSNGSVRHSMLNLARTRPDVGFTPVAFVMLSVAQTVQDKGGTWGEALEAASRVRTEWRYINDNPGNFVEGF